MVGIGVLKRAKNTSLAPVAKREPTNSRNGSYLRNIINRIILDKMLSTLSSKNEDYWNFTANTLLFNVITG